MKYVLYGAYAAFLGVVALFTKEIVTFIMLGMILLALTNIYTLLGKIYKEMKNKS